MKFEQHTQGMNLDFKSFQEEVNVFIDRAGGKVGSYAEGVSRIRSRVALKEL